MTDEKKKKGNVRAVTIPKSLYEKYEIEAEDKDKFVTEIIRDTLRKNAPKKKEEEKEKKDNEW